MIGNNCTRCIYTDSPCVPSNYGRDKYGYCDHFKSVFEENIELKGKLKNLEGVAEIRLANWQRLDKENKELTDQLSKAKGFIEKLLIVSCNSEVLIQYPNCKEVLEARVALEQFLMECE